MPFPQCRNVANLRVRVVRGSHKAAPVERVGRSQNAPRPSRIGNREKTILVGCEAATRMGNQDGGQCQHRR